jgi:hypothetical protein
LVGTGAFIVIAIGIAISSFALPWAEVVSSNGFVDAALTPMDLAGAIGSEYGPCSCPPWAIVPRNESQGMPYGAIQDITMEAIVPALVSVTFLAAGAWIFPLALLLSFISMFRRKVMILSALLFVLSGASWIAGMAIDANGVNLVLSQWAGQSPRYTPPTVSVYLGPYFSLLSGVVLCAGYLLARRGV